MKYEQTPRELLKKEAYEALTSLLQTTTDKRPMVKDEQWQEGFIQGYVIGREKESNN